MPEARLVSRYELVSLLGRGGAGEVWLAADLSDGGRRVALKVLARPSEAGIPHESLREEFVRARTLRHPNLVRVLDQGYAEETGQAFYTMEYCAGGDLRALAGKVGAADLVWAAREMLAGIGFLHGRGWVHGDLKTSNVLLDSPFRGGEPRPRLRIGDLSLAFRPEDKRLAALPGLGGTLAYMAPELLEGGSKSPASDLYALGVILHEIWTGRLPFEEVDPARMADRIRLGAPAVASDLRPGLPAAVADLIAALLARDPADRPRSAHGAQLPLAPPRTRSEPGEPAVESWLLAGPMVGREEDLGGAFDLAESVCREQTEGRPVERPVLLALLGEPGVGKTRLLDEIEARLDPARIRVLRGRSDGSPWGPFREILRSLAGTLGSRHRLLEGRGMVLAGILENPVARAVQDDGGGAGAEQLRVLQAASDLLLDASLQRATILLLDDVHRLDEASLRLLAFLLRALDADREEGTARPLGIVLAAREAGDPTGRILRETPGTRVRTLGRLGVEDTGRFIEAFLGRLPRGTLPETLHRLSGGNPLLALEVLRGWVSAGALRQTAEGWEASEEAGAAMGTPGLRSAVVSRFAALPPDGRAVLAAAAALGGTGTVRQLARVAQLDESVAAQAVLDLERRGSLELEGPACARIAQEVYAGIVLRRIPLARRAHLHALALEALDLAAEPGEVPVLRKARIATRAGHPSAPALWERAARETESACDPAGARGMLRRAWLLTRDAGERRLLRDGQARLDRLAGNPGRAARTWTALAQDARAAGERARFLLLAGESFREASDYARATIAIEEGLAASPPEEDRLRLLDALARVRIVQGDAAGALELLRDALGSRLEERLGRDPDLRMTWGAALAQNGRHEEALVHYRAALQDRLPSGDLSRIASTLNSLGVALSDLGRLDEAAEQHEASLEAMRRAGDLAGIARSLNNLGVVHWRRGDAPAAGGAWRESLGLKQRLGDWRGVATTRNNLGMLEERAERWEEALAEFRRAEAILRRIGDLRSLAVTRINAASVQCETGQVREALAAVDEARALSGRDAPGSLLEEAALVRGLALARMGEPGARDALAEAAMACDPEVRVRARAELADLLLEAGEFGKARGCAREAVREAASLGRSSARGRALLAAGWTARACGDPEEARARAAEAEGLCRAEGGSETLRDALLLRGLLREEEGDLPGALELATEALEVLRGTAGRLPAGLRASLLEGRGARRVRSEVARLRREADRGWEGGGEFFPDPRLVAGALARSIRDRSAILEARAAGLEGELRGERERAAKMDTLLQMAAEVNSLRPLDELLPLLMDRMISIMRAERGFLMLADAEGELRFRVARDHAQRSIDPSGFPVSRGIVTRVFETGDPVLTSDARADERFRERQSVFRLDLHSIVVVPLRVRDRRIGVVYVDNRYESGAFGREDLRLLDAFATQAAIAISNAQLLESATERERMEQELRIARSIQQGLLPTAIPGGSAWDVHARMVPAREVGGDYYDFLPLSGPDVRVAIGDVAGKGVPAGLTMVMARTILRSLAGQGLSTRGVLAQANRILGQSLAQDSFMSALLVSAGADGRTLRCTSAGHEPMMIFRAREGRAVLGAGGGVALGILDDLGPELEEETLTLEAGDAVLLYTDGAVQCRAADGGFYGRDRLLRRFEESAGGPAERVIAAILEDLESFRGQEPAFDDVTLIALRPGGGGLR